MTALISGSLCGAEHYVPHLLSDCYSIKSTWAGLGLTAAAIAWAVAAGISGRFGDRLGNARITLLGVAGGDFRGDVSSGARIEIEGACAELDASASSGGSIRADRLQAQRGRLEASSGGSIEATVTQRLRANASSGGNIGIDGSPAERDTNSSSGGNVSIR
jgi:hypothetical protein